MNQHRHCMELLNGRLRAGKALGVGLDSDFTRIPREYKGDLSKGGVRKAFVNFNQRVVWATHEHAAAYLVNDAFYKAHFGEGSEALRDTIAFVHRVAPKVPVILNACVSDVAHSSRATMEYAFDGLNADGIVVNPYFGQDGLQPYLDQAHKAVIVTTRTSNPGSDEFQEMAIPRHDNVPLHRHVGYRVSQYWNKNQNCGLMVSPAAYGELTKLREIAREIPIFVNGIGHHRENPEAIEDSDIHEIFGNGSCKEGHGVVLCASRGIIFSDDPQKTVEALHNSIKGFRAERAGRKLQEA